MNRTTVNAARDAAIRFLEKANELLKDKAFDRDFSAGSTEWLPPPNAKSGTVRRASMDLTRDLAAMRRPS